MQFEGRALLSQRSVAKFHLIFSWDQDQALKSMNSSYIFYKLLLTSAIYQV